MKTFGNCETLVSGQAVDTCCWELNGTPPFSRDTRSEGQLHQYSLLTSLLDPWSISSLLCTLAIRHSVAGQATAASVTFIQRQRKETQRERDIFQSLQLTLLSVALRSSGIGLPKLALSLKPQGRRLEFDFIAGKWMGRVPAVACR